MSMVIMISDNKTTMDKLILCFFATENCVKTNFSALKTLSSHINSFFGPIILCFTMDSLFYNSTDLNAVLIAVNWLQGISSVTFLGFFVIILFLCGDIGLVVETSMRTWIDEMQMMKSKPDNFSQELPLLLEDVKRNAVGISGYIFVMNYTSIFNASRLTNELCCIF